MLGKMALVLLMMSVTCELSRSAEGDKINAPIRLKTALPTEICKVATNEDLRDKCVGKRVRIEGTVAQFVLNRDLHYPDVSSAGGYINQNHIDTQWGQLGYISKQFIQCKEKIEVEGVLRVISLFDDAKGNDNSPYIQALIVDCK
jgi:hypothetical protein